MLLVVKTFIHVHVSLSRCYLWDLHVVFSCNFRQCKLYSAYVACFVFILCTSLHGYVKSSSLSVVR